MTITISPDNTMPLSVLLNCELREKTLSIKFAEAYNEVFKQLAGRDHESMGWRREHEGRRHATPSNERSGDTG